DAQGSTNWSYFGTLLAEANGTLNNGNFAAEALTMMDQSALTNSTLNISNRLIISGTNCTLTHSTLRLLPPATGTLLGVAPATNATLSLNQGSALENNGVLSLGDGSGIGSGGVPPQSRFQISPAG